MDRYFSSAKSLINAENFTASIIELQTSFEIFIRNTIRLIVTKDGEDRGVEKTKVNEELDRFSKISFKNAIKHHLSKMLNENFSFENHPVILEWNERLYNIRNQIVHSGLNNITGNDASKAYNAYVRARNYITDKLVQKNYLAKEGKVDLKLFDKSFTTPEVNQEILKKLSEMGLIPEGIDIPQLNKKEQENK